MKLQTMDPKLTGDKDFINDKDFVRDNDSLYVMPLQIVPFATPALCRGRLIRNAVLKPAIEVFSYDDGTSGHILIEDISPDFGSHHFGWKANEIHPDLKILKKLAQLTSYDVYSLRILFRQLGFPVESTEYLVLSAEKKTELNRYMHIFTQPLIKHIYGHSLSDDLDAGNIVKLFSDPDSEKALKKIQMLADVLDMPIESIPTFLEDFADIYLSFSYYQKYLDDIVPKMTEMVNQINDLKDSWQMKQDNNLMQACKDLVTDLSDLTASTTGRFESFYRNTNNMWDEISAEKFRATETLIRSYHTTIGGVLCGLGIKMNAWQKRFPTREEGGPQARAELILSSMRPGMEYIKAIDKAAPRQSDIEKKPAAKPKQSTINPHAA